LAGEGHPKNALPAGISATCAIVRGRPRHPNDPDSMLKVDGWIALFSGGGKTKGKGETEPVSPYSHCFFSLDFSFDEEDLIRCSNARNSAVSSSMVLEGRWGKGSTSDMGRTSLGTSAPYFLLPRNCCISAAGVFKPARNPP
jgi:hypothetical protein